MSRFAWRWLRTNEWGPSELCTTSGESRQDHGVLRRTPDGGGGATEVAAPLRGRAVDLTLRALKRVFIDQSVSFSGQRSGPVDRRWSGSANSTERSPIVNRLRAFERSFPRERRSTSGELKGSPLSDQELNDHSGGLSLRSWRRSRGGRVARRLLRRGLLANPRAFRCDLVRGTTRPSPPGV
jgi:hypothetical protein